MKDAGVALASLLLLQACGSDPLSPLEAPASEGPRGLTVSGSVDGSEIDTQVSGESSGADAPAPEPSNSPADTDEPPATPSACEAVTALAGSCPGYGYACNEHSEEQTWCLYDVLETLPEPCALFEDGSLCNGPDVSALGYASCQAQACLGLTTFDACYGNLVILCDYAY